MQCLECGAEGPTGGTIDEAIGGWNNRRAAHYSDDDKGRAQRMNDAGVCNAEIARRLGCTASTVDGWVKSSHPTGRRFTEEEKVKAIYRVEDGEDVATVAAEIGAAYSTVYRWLKKEKRAI